MAAILSGMQELYLIERSCCAIGCCNRYSKGCGIHFYRFPKGKSKRSKWIAAVRREKWEPTEHTWLCSAHFISVKKAMIHSLLTIHLAFLALLIVQSKEKVSRS